jgi:polyhydroxyalkanoate synthesis regulator phasin
MLQEIKKGIFASLGTVLLTREKVEAITKKMVDESKLTKEEAKKLADDLSTAGQVQWAEIEEVLSGAMQKAVKSLNIAKRDEMETLKSVVDNLEKRVTLLEDRLQATKE